MIMSRTRLGKARPESEGGRQACIKVLEYLSLPLSPLMPACLHRAQSKPKAIPNYRVSISRPLSMMMMVVMVVLITVAMMVMVMMLIIGFRA